VFVEENGVPDYRKASGPNLLTIPAELQRYPNFVGWKYVPIKRSDGKIKVTKPLFVIGDHGRYASSTDPRTWTTWNTPYCGFDFDDCRNKETGEIHQRFRSYIHKLSSYTEVTPSGEGVRVLVVGRLPAGARHEFEFIDGSGAEIYDSGRYFTLTGDHLEGTPLDIRIVDVSAIYQEITADLEQDEAAEEERQKRASSNGTEFDVEGFLRRHCIKILRTKPRSNSIVYEIECQGSHGGYDKRDGKAFVKVFHSGAIFYGCLHKTCSHNNSDNHWRELRERFEPQRSTTARR